ncbi:hypothetical protein Q8F55_003031 [Vanrija albida]|uniref:ThuA-like domain-containing protein n=1 Tax=Vanrija albida TaxID=181172 RepID=A0ABR3QBC3_9TREE
MLSRIRPLLLIALMTATITAQSTPKVLVYTATRGYRHDSIPTAIDVLGREAASHGVRFEFSEDPGLFTDSTLAGFDGVLFVSNSEEVLDHAGQAALQRFFQGGGVYAGVHSASACLYNDTTYLQAVGALFDYHPSLQEATFLPLDKTHPATAHLPDQWRYTEEVYYFRSDPRSVGATVLLTVDEASYKTWYIESPESAQPLREGAAKAGRSFYTSLGHLNSTWENSTFIQHIFGGLTWALEGASTRAYGQGLVGVTDNVTVSASASASGTASGTAASGSHAASPGASAAPSASGSAKPSSAAVPAAGVAALAVGAAVAGAAVVL